MRWKIAAPLATTVLMLGATAGGIATEGQDPGLSALLFGFASAMFGMLWVEIIVAWWLDVHRSWEEQLPDEPAGWPDEEQ